MRKEYAITTEYFKQYRKKLGFANQSDVKNFFGAKDIVPEVDLKYVGRLRDRLHDIIDRIDKVVAPQIRADNLTAFKKEHIDHTLETMKKNKIFPNLNNQGRRPEQVFFSWMRGYVVSKFFLKAVGIIFGVELSKIDSIGDDDFKSIETFKRTPTADLEIKLSRSEKIRVEMQSGFTGINDIKQHEVLEAKTVFRERQTRTLAIHFDFSRRQAAFVKLDEIKDDDPHWITRIQEDSTTVFNIDCNYFCWDMTRNPPKISHIFANYEV